MEHEALKKQLQLVADETRVFGVKFDTIKLGPDPKEPRLIWAKGPVVPEIQDLRSKIYETLNQRPDDKPFRMHMTLARLSPPLQGGVDSRLVGMTGRRGIDWAMMVDRFVLYESHLLPEGAEYEVIEDFRFNPFDKLRAGM